MPREQVLAIEGWFVAGDDPRLLGTRCDECGTFFFPKETFFCRNPHCGSERLSETPLSRTGTVWSFAINHYPPPAPYVAADPFEPFGVAAVELHDERIVIMGMVSGDPSSLSVGDEVELVAEPLFATETEEHLVWKWRKR